MFASSAQLEFRRAQRTGFTLIEMLIVCGVLAVLAGMSWPAMRGMLSKARLQQGVDELQTTLRKARIQAMRTGTPTLVRYEEGGRQYRVEAWDTLNDSENIDLSDESRSLASTATPFADTSDPSTPVSVRPAPIVKELPVGVRFSRAGDATRDSMTLEEDQNLITRDDTTTLAEPAWGPAIVFQSTGRSANAALRLIDDRRFYVDIKLRGLTGIVSASAPVRD
ncbi:MAG: prepilin-type N-terminal cleavage/methylation domain-containing protein, partial [Planctomycetaceae bacterium]|nr:prepilin-type N-terminal cleavage/methylation domain-containing protein [Planctomycetaceae bacterium]